MLPRTLYLGAACLVIAQSSFSQPASAPAQPSAALAPLPAELVGLKRLPIDFNERARIAGVVAHRVPEAKKFEKDQELKAPPFIPGPRRFLDVTEFLNLRACKTDTVWSAGAFPSKIREHESYANANGCQSTYLPSGAVTATANAFFENLGTNGRTCATCHQPPSGLSVSKANIAARLSATSGTDPIFAGVDGANCPSNLPVFTGSGTAFKSAHSLLLQRGLFRIFISVPATAQFTVAVDHDPYGCNDDPAFNQDTVDGVTAQIVSTYRRPRISANLNFVNAAIPLPVPGAASAPAIMWDIREASLTTQASDATHGHAQAVEAPTADQVNQILAFELGIFSAQSVDSVARGLNAGGAKGGPVTLATGPTGLGGTPGATTFDEFNAWTTSSGGPLNARRASISRGEKLFNTKLFTISGVAGLNNLGAGASLQGACAFCHSQSHSGNDIFGNAAVLNIGIAGDQVASGGNAPSSTLPRFKVTCVGGATLPFSGAVSTTTNDLGLAMITGQCSDIGRFSVPQLRSLSARDPYFHDGSAKTLTEVVNFYNRRFAIGLTRREREDLVNFLQAL